MPMAISSSVIIVFGKYSASKNVCEITFPTAFTNVNYGVACTLLCTTAAITHTVIFYVRVQALSSVRIDTYQGSTISNPVFMGIFIGY